MLPFLAAALLAQVPTPTPTPPPVADQADWVRRDHAATLAGAPLNYQTTAGTMPIRNRDGVVEGHIYFTAYRRTDLPNGAKRPVTFVFNGGPGSASVWLHLGLVGPKRVKLGSIEGFMPPPPYSLVPNDESLLPESDLILIDPVGTGYSRPEKPENGKRFWSVNGDIDSVGEFIRSYLTDENRWTSPVFVMGESYGGIRGSGLSKWLFDHGVGLSGLILVSPYLNGSVQDPAKGNDQPYAFYLPTYAAAAWYHHKLSPALQKKSVGEVFAEAQSWVYDTYMPALLRGDALPDDRRKLIVAGLRRYTGLSETFLVDTNLRVSDWNWYKEILRTDRYVVGRYDSRFVGIDRAWNTDHPDDDASDTQVNGVFTSTINDYLPNEIAYKTPNRYYILGEGLTGGWDSGQGPVDETEALRAALHENPYTKVLVTMGYYDLACPMGTVDQALNQMELDPRLRGNIVRKRYPAGHMIYLDEACRKQLHSDLATFVKAQSDPTAPLGTVRPKG